MTPRATLRIVADIDWANMAQHYARACVSETLSPTPGDYVIVKLNGKEYTVPTNEAKPKEGGDFEQCA
jgi:hypothetical protein